MFFKGYKLASPGAIVALVCFFLPWMLFSCNGQPLAEFSGIELAMGPELTVFGSTRKLDAIPWLWLVPVAALIVLVLAIIAGKRRRTNVADKLLTLLLGLAPLLLMLMQWYGTTTAPEILEARQQGLALDWRFGFWGALAALLFIVIGGVMNWSGAGRASQQAPPLSAQAPPQP